jgi:LUD domain
MSTIEASGRFSTAAGEDAIAATLAALDEHGITAEVVDGFESARRAVLDRLPAGAIVMTNPSVTLDETGIAAAINDGDGFDSARNRMLKLDYTTQMQEMKAIASEADYSIGSVHAITTDGILLIASASGSQLAQYAWGAAHVILVAGAQKIVPTLADARQRIYEHSLKLEDGRALAAYGQNSYVGKILEIHQEQPGRIHVVLIRQPVGY